MRSLYISVLSLLALAGCTKERVDTSNNVSANGWVYNQFARDYLWRAQMREPATGNADSSPFDYFSQVVKSTDDRYSYVRTLTPSRSSDVMFASTRQYDFGFQTRLLVSLDQYVSFAEIISVIKDSPADRAGLCRGDIITSINGQKMPMSMSQYYNLANANSMTLYIPERSKTVTLDRAEYLNNPVIFDTVFMLKGIKAGYVVYNHFSAGDGALSDKLNEAFGRLKAQCISDLILDLRYNGGGEIDECRHLASLIVPMGALFDTFAYEENAYNYGNPKAFSRVNFLQPSMVDRFNVGAKRLFILATNNTASASEIIMHALKPFYGENLKIIGDRSTGKNVGGVRTTSSDGRMEINKITIRIYDKNKVSGYEAGIEPDYEAQEFSGLGRFGDATKDNIFRTLLGEVYGIHVEQQRSSVKQKSSAAFRYDLPEKGLFIK